GDRHSRPAAAVPFLLPWMHPANSCTQPTCFPTPSPPSLSLPTAVSLLLLVLPSLREPDPFPSRRTRRASLSTWLIRARTPSLSLRSVRAACPPRRYLQCRWGAARYLSPSTLPATLCLWEMDCRPTCRSLR